jgi:hypothetical protein
MEIGGLTLCGSVFRERLTSAFETVVDRTQDFTDSAYTSHEHREKILLICDRLKLELNQLLRIGVCLVSRSCLRLMVLPFAAVMSQVRGSLYSDRDCTTILINCHL